MNSGVHYSLPAINSYQILNFTYTLRKASCTPHNTVHLIPTYSTGLADCKELIPTYSTGLADCKELIPTNRTIIFC